MRNDEWCENIRQFTDDGFTIFRNVIDPELLMEADEHLRFLAKKYPGLRPEHYHHPLMRDDAFWVRLVTDSRLLDIAELFLGPNLASFTSHYICKPPETGQAVLHHQDGAYWKLSKMNGITLWLAIDASTPENGCLQMIPGTHRLPLQDLRMRDDVPNMLYSEVDMHIDYDAAVDLVLAPGDVSVHNPFIVHGSSPNHSKSRRCGMDMGFIPTTTGVESTGVYTNPLLVRGEPVEGVNSYRPWPKFDPACTIAFAGCESWNDNLEIRNRGAGVPEADEPDVMVATQHMIERLRQGTTSN